MRILRRVVAVIARARVVKLVDTADLKFAAPLPGLTGSNPVPGTSDSQSRHDREGRPSFAPSPYRDWSPNTSARELILGGGVKAMLDWTERAGVCRVYAALLSHAHLGRPKRAGRIGAHEPGRSNAHRRALRHSGTLRLALPHPLA